MPSLTTPENTPVVFVGTQGDVKVKDENGKEIKLRKGDKIPAGASISVGPQGGKIVFKQSGQTLKFENSGEVSLASALMQAADASQDTDIDTGFDTAGQITTTPGAATTQAQPAQQPLARPATRAGAAPAPAPARQGISEAPEVVTAERGEKPQQTATEVVAQMAENLVTNSSWVAAPIAEIKTQFPQLAEGIRAVRGEALQLPPLPSVRPEAQPGKPAEIFGPQLPEAPVIASFAPNTSVRGDNIAAEKTLTVSGTSGVDTTVTLLADGKQVQANLAVNQDGNWTAKLSVDKDATYKLTAIATNRDGDSSPSEPFTVTVDSAPPVLAFDNLVPDADYQFAAFSTVATISGTATPFLQFQLKAGRQSYEVTAGAEGRWSQVVTGLEDGMQPLSAFGQSVAGISIEQTAQLLVRSAPFDIHIERDTGVSNTDGITKADYIQITVKGQPGAKLSVKLDDSETLVDFDDKGLAVHSVALGSEATYPFEFKTIYKDGTGESTYVPFPVTLDQAKPVLIPDDLGAGLNTPDLRFTGSCNEENVKVTLKLVDKKTDNAILENTVDVVDGKYSFETTVPGDGTYTATLKAVDLAGNLTELKPVDIQVDQSLPATPTDITVENMVLVNDIAYLGSRTFTVTGKTAAGQTDTTAFLNIDNIRTPAIPVKADGSFSITYTTAATEKLSFTAQVKNSADNESAKSAPVEIKLDLDKPTIQEFINPGQPQTIKVFDPVKIAVKMSEPVQVTGSPKCKLLAGPEPLLASFNPDLSVKTPDGTFTKLVFSRQVPEGIKADSLTVPANPLLVDANNSIKDPVGHDVDGSVFTGATLNNYNFDTVVVLNRPKITRIYEDTGVDSNDGVTNSKQFLLVGTADSDETVYIFTGGKKYAEAIANQEGQWQVSYSPVTDDETVVFTAEVRFADRREVSNPFTVTHDALAPLVKSIGAETSEGFLAAGATLPITINLDSDVYPKGSLGLELGLDSGTVLVPVTVSGEGPVKTLTANYTVAKNSVTTSGLQPLKLVIDADASVTDLAGNPVQTVLSALPPVAQNIDAVPPHTSVDLESNWITSSKSPVIPITTKPFAKVTLTVAGKTYEQTADANGSCKIKVTDPLEAGLQSYTAVAVDRASVPTDTLSGSFTVNLDGPALDVEVLTTGTVDNYINTRKPTYSGTTDKNVEVVVKVDGKQIGSSTGPSWQVPSVEDLSEGGHHVEVIATAAATGRSTTNDFYLDADFTAPVVKLVTSHLDPKNQVLEVQCNEKTSDDSIKVFIKPKTETEAGFSACEISQLVRDGNNLSLSLGGETLKDADYLVQVKAIDEHGNEGKSAETAVVVSSTEPTISIDTPEYLNTKDVVIEGTSNAHGQKVIVKVNGTVVTTDALVEDGTGHWSFVSKGHDKTETLEVDVSVTGLNNIEGSANKQVHLKFTRPQIEVTSEAQSNVKLPVFEGTASKGEAGTKISVKTPTETLTAEVQESLTWQVKATKEYQEGQQIAQISAQDRYGNQADPVSFTYTLDFTAPAITVPESLVSMASSFSLSGTSDEDTGTVVYTLNSGAEQTTEITGGVWNIDFSELTAGSHNLTIFTRDSLGNQSAVLTRILSVEFKAPPLELTKEPGITNNQTPVWEGKATPDAKLTATLDGQKPQEVTVDEDGLFIFLPEQPLAESSSPYKIHFVSTDKHYEYKAELSSSVTIDMTGPEIKVTEGLAVDGSETVLRGTCSKDTKSIIVQAVPQEGQPTPFDAVVNSTEGTWECLLSGLTAQIQNVLITSEDNPGNKGAEVSEPLLFPQQLTLTLTGEPGRTELVQPEWKGTTKVPDCTIKVTIGNLGTGTAQTNSEGGFVFKPDFNLTEVEGGHEVTFKAEAKGYSPAEVKAKNVVLDITPPTITVDEFKPVTANATVTGSSSEAEGRVYLQVGQDGQVQSAEVKDFKWKLALTGLREGSQELLYKGADDLGNIATEHQSLPFEVTFEKAGLKLTESPEEQSRNTTPSWKGQFVADGTLEVSIDGKPAVSVTLDSNGSFTFTPEGQQMAGKHTAVFTGTAPGVDGVATFESAFEILPDPQVIKEPALTIDSGLITDKSTILTGQFPAQTGKVRFEITGENIDSSSMLLPVTAGTWKVELVNLIKQTATVKITALDMGKQPLPGFGEPRTHELQIGGDAPDSNIKKITGLEDAPGYVAGYGQALVVKTAECEKTCKPEDVKAWKARIETSFEKAGRLTLALQNKEGKYKKWYTDKKGVDLREDNSAEITQNLDPRSKSNSNLKFGYYDESLMQGQWQFKAVGYQYFEKGYILVGLPSIHYSFDQLVAGQFRSMTLPYHAAIEGSIPHVPGAIAGGVELGSGALTIPHFKDLFSDSYSLCLNLKTMEKATSPSGPYPALAGYTDGSQAKNYAVGAINENGQIGIQVGSHKLFSAEVVADGHWHHVCIIRNVEVKENSSGSTYTIMVDGKSHENNTMYFTHDVSVGEPVTAYELNAIGGTAHSDGRPMDYFKGTLDNLRGFSYALNEAEAAKQAPLLANINWKCTEARCAYEGDHQAGLIVREMIGNQLDDNSTLFFKINSINHDKLVTDFTVTFQNKVVDAINPQDRIYKITDVGKANLHELTINPDNPDQPYGSGKNKFGFQLNIDTEQNELDTSPDAIIRFNRGEYPFGTGISFGIGKEQTATPTYSDEILTQQDKFLPVEQGTQIHNYDGTKGSISLDGLEEMRAFFKDASHQDDALAALMTKTSDHEYDLKHPCTLSKGDTCADPLLHIDTVADNKQIVLTLDDHLVIV